MEILNDPQKQRTLSPTDWALNIFLASIPFVGLILLLVWAFGDSGNQQRQNWAKGRLIIVLIGLILAFLFFFVFGGMALLAGLADR